jgi:hypothetical protein
MDLVLAGTVKPSDVLYIARQAALSSKGRTALLAWLEAHLIELAGKSDGMHASAALGALGRVCSSDARSQADKVFRPLVSRVGGSMRRLDESLAAAEACVDLRTREEAALTRWLASRPAEAKPR